jgi:hypothetical protein
MLKYDDYSLIKADIFTSLKIINVIEKYNGSIFHEVDFNKIVEKTFNTELYYLVDNPKNISCLSPVHFENKKFGLKRYHLKPLYDVPYAGFIGKDIIFNFDKISIGNFDSIVYVGFPFSKTFDGNIDKCRIGKTCMVDLSIDEDSIFKNTIHSKRRNMIRKAIKSGIVVKKYTTIEGLDLYWPILKQLHDKLGFYRLTYEYYKQIVDIYGKKQQISIFIAYKDEIPISGIFVIGNKNYMHYYKGATLVGTKNEGQGELLQWEAIKWAKSVGTKYYDLCNLNEESLPEIYRFKTGISNEIFQYPIYSKNSLGYRIVNKIKSVL